MATVTKGKTFISGETVEPADMHQLVDSATVTNIVDADISASAAIAASKLAATLDLSSKTVTLPDSNIGTSKIADAAVTAAKLDGAQTGSAPIYGCRGWAVFDGTSVTNVGGEDRCTIRGSGNVSKVVRNSTGQYTVHFTTAMPSANYSITTHSSSDGFATWVYSESAPTTTQFGISTVSSTGATAVYGNKTYIHCAVFA